MINPVSCYLFIANLVWVHKMNLTPPLFIEVPVPTRIVSGHVLMCYALWVSILPLSMILIFDFRIVPTVWNFFFYHFIPHQYFSQLTFGHVRLINNYIYTLQT